MKILLLEFNFEPALERSIWVLSNITTQKLLVVSSNWVINCILVILGLRNFHPGPHLTFYQIFHNRKFSSRISSTILPHKKMGKLRSMLNEENTKTIRSMSYKIAFWWFMDLENIHSEAVRKRFAPRCCCYCCCCLLSLHWLMRRSLVIIVFYLIY